MKKILFSLLAVAAALVGCTREIEPEGSTVVPVSKYLVISADCAPMTKTDINEGKSTWEAGDKITVLYNGEAYEYVAGTPSEDGKQTYFTSTAGITDYDGTGLVAYYEALSAEDGTVGIAAERDIEFFDLAQKNPACAPLVGYTNAETLDNGVINMHFENIFSVIELRIDPAGSQMTSPMKTLKIEPAEGSEFEGYITCSGTVDASTLALDLLQTGNVLTLNFPEQADARMAQVIKFPVGRFTSSKGLKVTLTLEDGSELVKNIYKSGITTFSESDGRYSVQHLAKAMYAFSGGIGCAQDLVDFAAAVNNGSSLIEYMNDEGKVVLLDDIDMTGVMNWIPIGNGKFHGSTTGNDKHVSHYYGPAFKGYFDGCGKSILNLKMSAEITADNNVYGLFGILDGATVENLTVGAAEGDASELTFSAADSLDVGVVAGAMMSSTIRNCVNYVPMNVKGSTAAKRVTMAGFAGFVYANQGAGCTLENLVNYGSIKAAGGSNTGAGAASVMAAGIAGLANGTTTISTARNHIYNCINYGNIESSVARSCGILAAANQYTTIEDCKNYGDQVNTGTNVRVGMITAIMSNYTAMKGCENHGDLVLTQNDDINVQGGGLVCLISSTSAEITGGGNYGKIIGDILNHAETPYIGLIAANITDLKKIDGVIVDGGIGSYNGGNYKMVTLSTSNYRDYIGERTAANDKKITNLIFNGPDAKGIRTADDLMEFAALVNAGSSTAKFEQNGVVVLLNDIDMSGKSWTPIGKANAVVGNTNEPTFTGKPFTGKFNGGGYTIRNLKLVSSTSTAGDNFGFFSTLGSGAVVENLNFDSSCSLEVTATASVASGVLAGYIYDATVRNVTSHAPMTFNGKAGDSKFMSMAMIGESFAQTAGSVIENCHNYGEIKAYNSDNTNNGGNGYHTAGIVGYTMAPLSATAVTTISGCTNHGNMTSGLARTSGIVAGAPRNATISNCINYGDQFNNFYKTNNARLGGIVCIAASKATMTGCINYGDITSSTSAIIGGIACQYQYGTATGCENYGIILTDHASRGLLQGYDAASKAPTWNNCVAGGLVGTYSGGAQNYDRHLDDNKWDTFAEYLGNASNGSTFENITYRIGVTDPEIPTDQGELNVLFIGNSFTQDAVRHLPGMLKAAGIQNVRMTLMYYGGRLMTEHNAKWDSASDYTCYECRPGHVVWSQTKSTKLADIASCQRWDIVTIQEHTGNKNAWSWTSTAQSDINGLIDKIKTSQSASPKIYYIMSQAYNDMSRIGSGSASSVTWNDSFGMYDVIVDFAKNVEKECAIDGIIPTGTMLQNLRTTSLNNDLGLTRDGYHMDYGLARYGASCLVFEAIFAPRYGVKLDNNAYRYADEATGSTPVTDANAKVALQAARNALERPFVVTNMSGNPAGISSAADMYEFLTSVSAGTSLWKWTGTDGEVNLLADVNLSSITNAQWQALANATDVDNDAYTSVINAGGFSGVFDGNGNTVSGFNPTVTLAAGKSFGLIPVLDGATVKNLNLSGTMTVSATGMSDAGMLCGTATNSKIENVTVSGAVKSSGSSVAKRLAIGGVAGYVCAADGEDTLIKDCTSDVVVTATNGSNTGNGASGVMYGGIAGYATTLANAVETVTVKKCVNNGNMNVTLGRCSGIAATIVYGVTLEDCINNGDQTNAFANGRLGNITCYMSNGSKLIDCVNNGDLTVTDASYSGTIAGVVALAAAGSATVEGGGNYGVLTAPSTLDDGKWKGLIAANFGGASMKNVVVSGKMFYAGSQIEINADNFTNYVCGNYDASKMTGLTFVAPNN